MKLRIQDNSIRVRLSIEELDQLCSDRPLIMRTELMHGSLQTEIRPVAQEGRSSLGANGLIIEVPLSDIKALKDSEAEGLTMDLGGNHIAIEKDFACIGRSEKLNAGLFPNPKAADGAC